MKVNQMILPALLCLGFTACSEDTVEGAREKTLELVDQAYTVFQREQTEMVESLDKTLVNVRAKTARLKEQAKEKSGEAREAILKKLEELEPYEQQLEEKVKQLKSSSQETWDDTREGAAELKQRCENAWEAFKEEP